MRTRWWWVSSLGFLLSLLGVLALLRFLPDTLLAQFDKLSSIGNLLVSVVSLVVGVVGLWQAKAQSPVPQTQGQVAEQLASAVRRQWESEAEVRRLNDPYPLPVSWEPAPDHLFVNWESNKFAARTGAGSRRDPTGLTGDPPGWASTPSELCGTNNELVDVVSRRVPTRRLVVLGEPGAGKTILLVRLVLDLLDNRASIDSRVPVLVSLASWNPADQDLLPWLKQTMTTDNPWLRQPAPNEAPGITCVDMLLDGHKILPILDGLDEIPDAVRASAIEKINDWLGSSMKTQLVLSSRLDEYETLVQASKVAGAKLTASAGVIVRDLDADDIKNYLERDAGDDAAAVDRWSPVVALLGKGGPVDLALRTPLMVGLARTIYNPRVGEPIQNVKDPRGGEPIQNVKDPHELCRTEDFPDHHAVERHLFDGFIPASYRKHPDKTKRCPWKTADAERWLRNLARHLGDPSADSSDGPARRAPLGRTDLAWWELHASVSPWLIGVTAAVVPGLAVGLAAGYGRSLGIGLGVGLLLGVAVSVILHRRSTGGPVAGIAMGATFAVLGAVVGGLVGQSVGMGRGPAGGLVGAVGVGLGVGPIGGLLGGALGGFFGGLGVGFTASMAPGVPAGIVDGLGGGVAAALILVLAGRPTPARGLRGLDWSRKTFLWVPAIAAGAVAGIGLGMTAGPVAGLAGALAGFCLGLLNPDADLRAATSPRVALVRDRLTFLTFGLASGATVFAGASLAVAPIVGVAGGITVGLVFGCLQAAWGKYTIARYWLALRRQIPWRLMTFLVDAHEKRGVLRQVGAVYQFRHADLQRHLAERR